ncbi:MAG: hypothetical protein U0670_16130 [Anaerolineae bacterium]
MLEIATRLPTFVFDPTLDELAEVVDADHVQQIGAGVLETVDSSGCGDDNIAEANVKRFAVGGEAGLAPHGFDPCFRVRMDMEIQPFPAAVRQRHDTPDP